MERYRTSGVRLALLIDPQQQSITVYDAASAPRTLTGNDVVDGGDVLPGFRLRVSTIFDDPQAPLS
jgi:Uma2 family endonuclease